MMITPRINLVIVLFLVIISCFHLSAFSECTCDIEQEKESNVRDNQALKYKLIAIASILFSSAIGITLPLWGRSLAPGTNLFFLVKSFAAGVILATGFVHILPDAFDNLSNPCLVQANPVWDQFPFAAFITMVSTIITMLADVLATSYWAKGGKDLVARGVDEEKDVHVKIMGVEDDTDEDKLFRHRVICQVLEAGIVVHSVIIGVSLGTSQSTKVIRPLIAALTFHQLFEGLGLGGCISQAKLKATSICVMVAFFSLTTPIGIAIGIGISHVYDDNSPMALIVEGVFNAAAAGILIHMALVDLLAHDFMGPKLQSNVKLMLGSTFSLLLGSGFMSLLAKWA